MRRCWIYPPATQPAWVGSYNNGYQEEHLVRVINTAPGKSPGTGYTDKDFIKYPSKGNDGEEGYIAVG